MNKTQQIIQNKKQMLFNLLQGKVDPNINAMRQITSKVEKKEMNNIMAEGQSVTNNIKRIPKNLNSTRMPKMIVDAMMGPSQKEVDSLFPSSDNTLLEERDIPQEKFNTYNQFNEKLNNYKNISHSHQNNGNGHQQLPISEEKIRKMIKEEVYNILEKIVKKEEESRLSEEQITLKIGKTLFSAKLKPIVKLNKK